MQKIAMIGASGHGTGFCVPSEPSADRKFVAVAPGSAGESVHGLLDRIHAIGEQPIVYNDYKTLLREAKPDVVVVDNFYGEHAPVIEAAFRAGCHVFAEKPAAATPEQYDRLTDAWKVAGTQFAAMFNYRYVGAFYGAKQLIASGAIGEVRLMNAQKSYKFGRRPEFMTQRATYGGTIPWVGIHAIDWILWMGGKRFVSVRASQSAAEAANGKCPETAALALFELAEGGLASLTVDYLNPSKFPTHGDDRIRVIGTRGEIEVRDAHITLINSDGVQHPENAPDADLFTDFLRQIETGAPCRLSGAESFAATRAAILAQVAADTGKTVWF